MKSSFIKYLLVGGLTIFFSSAALAQNDFRSRQTGDWNVSDTWEEFTGGSWQNTANTPTSTDGVITVLSGNIVTIPNGFSINIDQTIVEGGGQISIATGGTMNVLSGTGTDLDIQIADFVTVFENGIVDVSGVLNSAGQISSSGDNLIFNNLSDYQHNQNGGNIPLGSWGTGSTCEITGVTSAKPSNLNQIFYNFTWNCASQSSSALFLNGELTTVNGNLTIEDSNSRFLGLSLNQSGTTTVGGDLNINNDSKFYISAQGVYTLNIEGSLNDGSNSTSFSMLYTATGTVTVNLTGAYNKTGSGTQNLSASSGSSDLNIGGDVAINGTVRESGSSSSNVINFNGSSVQTFSGAGSFTDQLNIELANNTSVFLETSVIGGSGTFTTGSNCTIGLGSLDGSGALQSGSSGGNIRITGTRTYGSNLTLSYNGAAAQSLGNGYPAGGDANLTIDNSGGVTMNSDVTLNSGRDLALSSGNLVIGSNTLALNGSVSGSGGLTGGSTSNLEIGGTGSFGTLTFVGSNSLNNLTFNRTSSGSVDLGGDLTIEGTLTQTNGNINIGANTLTLSGAYVRTGGSIGSLSSSMLIIDGTGGFSSIALSSGLFNTLTLNRNGVVFSTTSSLSLTNLNLLDGTLTTSGGLNMTSGGTITRRENGTLTNAVGTTNPFNLVYDIANATATGNEMPTTTNTITNLTKQGSATLTLNKNITVNGDMTLSNGVFNAGSQTIIFEGGLVLNATGSFSSATTIFDGTTTISGSVNPDFGNVTVNNGAALTLNNTTLIGGNLVSNGTINPGTGTVTFDGTTTISGTGSHEFNNVIITGTLTAPNAGSGNLQVAGNWTFTSGTFNHNSGTVEFTGTGTTISGNDTDFNNVTITGTLNAPSNLYVAGNLQNNGTYNVTLSASGTQTVNLNGTGGQQISGTINMNNLTLGAGTRTVNINSTTDVYNTISVGNNVTLDVDGSGSGNLTLRSNASGTARIAELGSGASLAGSLTLERYKSGGNGAWNHLGFAIQNVPVSQLQDDFVVYGSASGLTSGNASTFYWDETYSGSVDDAGNWTTFPVTTNAETMSTTLGLVTYIQEGALTIDVSGQPNFGSRNFGVSYTSSGSASDDGWNVLSNPYPSAIDWASATGWTKTNVNGTMAIWDGQAQAYNYISGGGGAGSAIIPSGQAFWVQTNAAAPNLAVTEAVKFDNKTTNYLKIESNGFDNFLDLALVNTESGVEDKTFISFQEDAVAEFDSKYDARKLKNFIFNLSTVSVEDELLAMNFMSSEAGAPRIPLRIDNIEPGTYTFELRNLESFADLSAILIHDKYDHVVVDILNDGGYEFDLSDEENTFMNRFEIEVVRKNLVIPVVSSRGNTLTSTTGEGYQWYKNNEIIDGATEQSYNFSEDGSYHVEIVKGSDFISSESITVIVTAAGLEIGQELTLFPNPTRGVAKMKIPESYRVSEYQVKVMEVSGRVISENKYNRTQAEVEINLADLKKGVYFVTFNGDGFNIVKKLIKE